jgi:superkiller protein 3
MTTDWKAENLESLARREAAVLQRPWDAEAWGQLGLEYRFAGYHELALPVLRRGAELGTPEPYHWYHFSNALDQVGEHEQALAAARKAVAIAPDSNRMLATLGSRLLACGKPHEAISCLEPVARRLPDWAEAKGLLGIAHYRVQQFAAAAEWLEAALRIDPEGPDASAWALLGVSLDETGRFEGAVYALETAVFAKPDYGWAWARMGKSLRALGRHAEAVGAYEKAVENDFAPAIVLWDMGLSAIEVREAKCADRACRALRKLDAGMATRLRRRLRTLKAEAAAAPSQVEVRI